MALIESPSVILYQWSIVTVDLSGTVWNVWRLKGQKVALFPAHPDFVALARVILSEFPDEPYLAEN